MHWQIKDLFACTKMSKHNVVDFISGKADDSFSAIREKPVTLNIMKFQLFVSNFVQYSGCIEPIKQGVDIPILDSKFGYELHCPVMRRP